MSKPPYTKAPRRGLRVCEACGAVKSPREFRKTAKWVNRTCLTCELLPGRGARG